MDAMEKRLSSSSSTCSSESSVKPDDNREILNRDIINLKDRNHALEKKLKKYLSHCASLEEERATVLEVIKSCVPGKSSKDLNTAIIALCEKVNSLEDECSIQDEAKRKATVYLNELEHLKEKLNELELKYSESENRISVLSRSEKDLQIKLKYTREELLSLRQKHDDTERSTQESENDKSRQISYLERENLQLHKELKAAKGLLRNAANQANSVGMPLQDPIIDLQRISACSPLKALQAMKETITNKSPDTQTLHINHMKDKPPMKSPPHSARRRSAGHENKKEFTEKREVNDENTMECNPS